MRRSSRLVLLLGAFLAVVVFVVVLLIGSGGGGTPPTPTAPTELSTVVGSVDVPLGGVVTADMVTTKKIAVAARDADALGDVSQAIGKIARRPILAGAQVHATDFTAATLQLTVPAGKKAFAVEVNEKTGVGNLIFPGDYVDVVITFGAAPGSIPVVVLDNPTVGGPNKNFGPANPPLPALTVKAPLLLQEIQVIGTIDAPKAPAAQAQAPAQGQAAATPAPSGPALTDSKKLIILAVTDAQAEVLVFARTSNCGLALTDTDCAAAIDLVLRSPEDKGIADVTDGVILKTLLDTYGVLPPYAEADLNVAIPAQP